MIEVRAKVGTHPVSVIYIGWKRKLPKVGDRVKFRTYPYDKHERWQGGIVDEVRDVGYSLYYISRW